MVVFGHSPEPKRSRGPAAQAGHAEGDTMAFHNEEVAYLLIEKWTIYQLTSTSDGGTAVSIKKGDYSPLTVRLRLSPVNSIRNESPVKRSRHASA